MTAKTKRRLVALVATAAVALLAFAGTVVVSHKLAEHRLAAALERLGRADPDWRLDDFVRPLHAVPLPDAENLAVCLADITATIARPPYEVAQRHADLLAGLVPNVRLTREQWRAVIDGVEWNEEAILPALDLDGFPRGRFGVFYTPDVQSTRLQYDADVFMAFDVLNDLQLAAVQRGDAATALRAFRGTLNLGRSLRAEPTAAAPHCRARLRLLAVRGIERLLGHCVLDDGQLAGIDRELRAELADDLLLAAVRGELTLIDRRMTAIRTGAMKSASVREFGPTPVARSRAVGDVVGDWLKDRLGTDPAAEHAELLEIGALAVAAARRPWPERWPAVAALPRRYDLARPELVRWFTPDFPRQFSYFAYDECRVRCALAAVAAERYRLARGDWPTTLAAVGPLPDDPFTGRPLKYKRLADGVAVYSVGPDLADDGGELADADPMPPRPHADFGFRLYDGAHRNRPPGDAP